MTDAAWSRLDALAAQPRPRIAELFAHEPERLARLTVDAPGLHLDLSKGALTLPALDALLALAEAADVAGWRERLFAGAVVNPSEERAATHTALRPGVDPELAALVGKIDAGELGEVRHVLHVGIGGSALGPALALDAVRDGHRYDVAVVANIDGAALAEVFARFDPAKTLLVVVSKTFTTLETLRNGLSVMEWMRAGGVGDPVARSVAVTAAPAKARAQGAEHVLPFAETVGGRYSLWSAVGFSVALAWGLERWGALLAGAAAADGHFRDAPLAANAPVLAALVDLWNAGVLRHPTRAVFAYDERLRLLPSYLQQLEMESNGKRVDREGRALTRPSAAATWGGVGTDAQHAVFQWLHQGTGVAPVEFLAVKEPGHALDPEHHRQLLANCLAQGSALMTGRAGSDADAALAAARTFPGERPSATIALERLGAWELGALLAFYEHRTFSAGVIGGWNPFDQWGVELGKEVARSIAEAGAGGRDPSTAALAARLGLG